MLYIPDHYRTFTLLAIDPGVNNLGVSLLDIETRTGRIENIDVRSIVTNKLNSYSGMYNEYVSERDQKLKKICDAVSYLCREYNPSAFVYESPFYNPLMPAAYGSLCEVVAGLRNAVLDYNPNTYIDCISPQGVKKGVGAAGIKGKDIMKEKIFEIPEIMNALSCHPDDLSEHCIDSLAVAYTYRNTVLKTQEQWRL